MAQVKRCMVPLCYNTSDMMPDKIFIHVPRDYRRRLLWFQAVGKDVVRKRLSLTTTLYCCEDHFDLREDTENFLEHKLVGCRLRTKKDALPHIFDCQRLSRTPSPVDPHADVYGSVERPIASDVYASKDRPIASDVYDSVDRPIASGVYASVDRPIASNVYASADQLATSDGSCSKTEVDVESDKDKKIKEEPDWCGNADDSPSFTYVQMEYSNDGAFAQSGDREGGVKSEPLSDMDPLSLPGDATVDEAAPLAQLEQVNVKLEPLDSTDAEPEDVVHHCIDVNPFLLPTRQSSGRESPSFAQLGPEDVKIEPVDVSDVDPTNTASTDKDFVRGMKRDSSTRSQLGGSHYEQWRGSSCVRAKSGERASGQFSDNGRKSTSEEGGVVLTSLSMLEQHLLLHSKGKSDERGGVAAGCKLPTVQVAPQSADGVERPYSCDVCGRRFTFRCNLKTHLRTHTGERPHKCTLCSQSFVQNIHLVKHMVTHTGERPYSCTVCRRSFTQGSSLRNHMRLHTGERPYECGICRRRFRQRSVLTFHLSTHEDGRPHRCAVCGRNFAKSSSLYKHMGVHTGERPYGCELCDQKYARRSELVAHTRSHTGERPYACAVCARRYGSKLGLNMHMRSHTGERPYTCEICNKSYARPSVFAIHKRIHTGGKKYSCPSCDKSYLRRSDLTKHTKMCKASQ